MVRVLQFHFNGTSPQFRSKAQFATTNHHLSVAEGGRVRWQRIGTGVHTGLRDTNLSGMGPSKLHLPWMDLSCPKMLESLLHS